MSLVSIIMAAYNAGKYIEESIYTVLTQTHANLELIIVNDGSTDNTRLIIDEFCAKDKRIKLLDQENRQQAAARNAGYLLSSGDWIIFLDADDLWEPTILEKLLESSAKYPDCDVVYTNGWMMYNDDKNNVTPYPTITGYYPAHEMYLKQYECNYIPNQSAMMKRKALELVGLQEENRIYHGCEDYDFWIRIAKAGGTFYGLNEKLFYYRKHQTNMSNNRTQMQFAYAMVLIKNFNADYFDRQSSWKAFRPHVYPGVVKLLKAGRRNDAIMLLGSVNRLSHRNATSLVLLLVLLFGRFAIVIIKAINRIDRYMVSVSENNESEISPATFSISAVSEPEKISTPG